MTIKEYLINVLKESGFPIYKQGSFLDTDEYPHSFWTFYNIKSEELYRDDEAYAIVKHFTVCFYSDNPTIIHDTVNKTRKKLKEANFFVEAETDVDSDATSHTGEGFFCIYQYNYEN